MCIRDSIRRGKISEEQFDKFIETSKNIAELPYILTKLQQYLLQRLVIDLEERRNSTTSLRKLAKKIPDNIAALN